LGILDLGRLSFCHQAFFDYRKLAFAAHRKDDQVRLRGGFRRGFPDIFVATVKRLVLEAP
jgi:hypothetical protein